MDGVPCPTASSLCPMRYATTLLHALHFLVTMTFAFTSSPPPLFFSRLTQDSNALLSWELSYLGLKIINSQFVGGGYGLATNESTTFSPRELVCQYFGRFLVLTKSQTDELFNPIFFGNHERLILLTSTMQPIVHHHQTKPDTYDQVSFFCTLLDSGALQDDVFRFLVFYKG